jgi:hypothetical protein
MLPNQTFHNHAPVYAQGNFLSCVPSVSVPPGFGALSGADDGKLPDLMVVVAKDNEWIGISEKLQSWYRYNCKTKRVRNWTS